MPKLDQSNAAGTISTIGGNMGNGARDLRIALRDGDYSSALDLIGMFERGADQIIKGCADLRKAVDLEKKAGKFQASAETPIRPQPKLQGAAPLQAAAKVPTVWKGDAAEYTGETRQDAGGTLYVLKILEGHRAGDLVVTYKPPGGQSPFIERNRQEQEAKRKQGPTPQVSW